MILFNIHVDMLSVYYLPSLETKKQCAAQSNCVAQSNCRVMAFDLPA